MAHQLQASCWRPHKSSFHSALKESGARGEPGAHPACRLYAQVRQQPRPAYIALSTCTSGALMQTKLTLRLGQRLIRRAKAYARRTGKSVSELVADFFGRLETPAEGSTPEVVAQSPAVQSLVGALAGAELDEADYRAHLVEKHA